MPSILVVEDESDVREIIVEFLRGLGYGVLQATSAQEARQVLASETVAAILVDCLMSGEHGSILAQHGAALGIPAILMTGDHDYVDTLAGSAPFPVLRKPFRLTELERLVAAALGGTAAPPG